MKKSISRVVAMITGLLIGSVAVSCHAGYFQLANPSHLELSAGFGISPKSPGNSAGLTDVGIVVHPRDPANSIVPESWRSFIPPESWVPLQFSFGGNFKGEAVGGFGSSANLAPIFAGLFLRNADERSNSVAGQVKSFMLGHQSAQLRLGANLMGDWIKDGHFQSLRAAYPGQGFFDIIGNAARIDVGLGWTF